MLVASTLDHKQHIARAMHLTIVTMPQAGSYAKRVAHLANLTGHSIGQLAHKASYKANLHTRHRWAYVYIDLP